MVPDSISAEQLAARLSAHVGGGNVLTDPGMTASYERDWTGRFGGAAMLVVRPGSTAEVSEVMRECSEAGVAVVPQGGNTGLVGGGVPRAGEVVVSLTRLGDLGPVDEASAQLTAGAGVTLEAVQAKAAAAGLELGVDLAARQSATIGGMIATNAGGIHVLRYGAMRAQVLGIEAVMADGSIISHLQGLVKDNTGYDLAGLITGSEGTLAVVTAARLRLVPRLMHRVVALVGLADIDAAVHLAAALRRGLASLHALELVGSEALALVREHTGMGNPLGQQWPYMLLVECALQKERDDLVDELAEIVAAAGADQDVAVATDSSGCAMLWAYRERVTEAVSAAGVPHKLDVTLPPTQLSPFVAALRERLGGMAGPLRTAVFGHLGDGNLHVNILGAAPDDYGLDDTVLRLVAAHGGSISSEHGIGVAKAPWMKLARSPAEMAAMAAIRHALDPAGMLNPGVLF
ncbi:MAG: FAD-binding oxidoreductase [Acidimicrobiales bacterium]